MTMVQCTFIVVSTVENAIVETTISTCIKSQRHNVIVAYTFGITHLRYLMLKRMAMIERILCMNGMIMM